MGNVSNKRCVESGCRKNPVYNLKGFTRGMFCTDHKHAGMVNVLSPRCKHADCEKILSYNVEGTQG